MHLISIVDLTKDQVLPDSLLFHLVNSMGNSIGDRKNTLHFFSLSFSRCTAAVLAFGDNNFESGALSFHAGLPYRYSSDC